MPQVYQLPLFSFEKVCSQCLELLPITTFGPMRGKAHSHTECRACMARRARDYAQRNAEKIKAARAARYIAQREERLAYARAYHETHKDARRAQKRVWYHANAAELCAKARLYKNHRLQNDPLYRAQTMARVVEWHRLHPQESRLLKKRARHRRRAQRAQAEGSFVRADIRALEIAQAGLCAYCHGPYDRYHIEHKQPLSRGGTNWPDNLCLACADCNLSKGRKTESEFRALLAIP